MPYIEKPIYTDEQLQLLTSLKKEEKEGGFVTSG